jgi:hypothetical protein
MGSGARNALSSKTSAVAGQFACTSWKFFAQVAVTDLGYVLGVGSRRRSWKVNSLEIRVNVNVVGLIFEQKDAKETKNSILPRRTVNHGHPTE